MGFDPDDECFFCYIKGKENNPVGDHECDDHCRSPCSMQKGASFDVCSNCLDGLDEFEDWLYVRLTRQPYKNRCDVCQERSKCYPLITCTDHSNYHTLFNEGSAEGSAEGSDEESDEDGHHVEDEYEYRYNVDERVFEKVAEKVDEKVVKVADLTDDVKGIQVAVIEKGVIQQRRSHSGYIDINGVILDQ